ncbi:MAG: hypothetical protein ABR501_14155 [Pyrinomonadaceae bacterium]
MRIELAHLQARSTTGQLVDFAAFFAKANNDNDQARAASLIDLKIAAGQAGLKVDAAALVYEPFNEVRWWGDAFVVDYINKRRVPEPNRYIES